jgi:hypothetical protein
MKKIIAVLSLFTLYLPLFSLAHPGHGDTDGYSIIHYFTEPVHAFVWAASIIVIALFIHYFSRYGKKVKKTDHA